MDIPFLEKFFPKAESLLAIDIGSSSIKMMELDLTGDTPKLVNIGVTPTPADSFASNVIEQTDSVSEQVIALLESNGIVGKRAVLAMPGPSVFTKQIQMEALDHRELQNNLQFEASNYIPHNIDDIQMDFHVLGSAGKGRVEVLLVAAKNEVVDSFMDTVSLAGLETAIVDVDYFTIQNAFETSYPELVAKTCALINIGARFASVNICRDGNTLFTGDVSIGSSSITEDIVTQLGVSAEQAEQIKVGEEDAEDNAEILSEIIDRNSEEFAVELNRQLSFFWNTAVHDDDGIDQIVLCGGGALLSGLSDELSSKTGVDCMIMNPLRAIESGEGFDAEYLKDIAPYMGVCVGLALREIGDKELEFDFDE